MASVMRKSTSAAFASIRRFTTSPANRSKIDPLRLPTEEEIKASSAKTWKMSFFLIGIPALILCNINAFVLTEHEPRPEFVKYEHLRIRTKRFPWGDGKHSLFHNPHTNALPDGYETEDEHH